MAGSGLPQPHSERLTQPCSSEVHQPQPRLDLLGSPPPYRPAQLRLNPRTKLLRGQISVPVFSSDPAGGEQELGNSLQAALLATATCGWMRKDTATGAWEGSHRPPPEARGHHSRNLTGDWSSESQKLSRGPFLSRESPSPGSTPRPPYSTPAEPPVSFSLFKSDGACRGLERRGYLTPRHLRKRVPLSISLSRQPCASLGLRATVFQGLHFPCVLLVNSRHVVCSLTFICPVS